MAAGLVFSLAGCANDTQKQNPHTPQSQIQIIDENRNTVFVNEFKIPARAPYENDPPLTGTIRIEKGKIGEGSCNPETTLDVAIDKYMGGTMGYIKINDPLQLGDLEHEIHKTVLACVMRK